MIYKDANKLQTLRIGDGTNNTTFASDGSLTFNGNATVWDDFYIPGSSFNMFASNPPIYKTFKFDGTGDINAVNFNSCCDYGTFTTYTELTNALQNDNHTVEFWVKPTLNTDKYVAFGQEGVIEYGVIGVGGFLKAYHKNGTDTEVLSTSNLNINSWNHIMYVDSANRTRMYVNGVSQTNTSRTDISGWTTPIVGALNTSGDNSLNGSLTQMLVYSVALSASQVAERYNLGHGTDNLPTGITTQCVMRFKFSEGTGDTVDNSATAGAGYDMTLADTPTWVNGILGSSGSPGVMLPAWQYGKLQSTTFNVPIPHGWNPSNTLHPHIHIIPESDLSNGQTIVFEMEWTFANIGEAYGNTAVVEATYVSDGVTYNGTHILVEFPDWHPTLTTVSAEYIVRINRGTDTYTGDVFVLNFGVHGEIKQVGSRQLYIF